MASDNEKTKIKISRWQNIDSSSTTDDNNKANICPLQLPSSAALPKLINVTLPSLVNPATQSGLLLSSNIQSLLGEVPNLLNTSAGHQLFAVPPTNIPPPLRVFNANEQRQSLPSSLVGFFQNHQQQNFLPNQLLTQQSFDLVNTFLENHQKNAAIVSLNNSFLCQLTNRQRENGSSREADLVPTQKQPVPIPLPPLPPNTSSMEAFMVPPPPPPPMRVRQTSHSLVDSPMDIEDDENEEASEKEGNAKGCETKGRNKKVQMADELMKQALRPHFKRRRITKDEYKEIMKKGVAKLKKRHSLKAEKVEKFVSKYVQSVAGRRRNQRFGY